MREILRHLSNVCLSVRSNHDCVRKNTSNYENRLLLANGRSVLKKGYIGPQDLVPTIKTKPVFRDLGHMERPIHTKYLGFYTNSK